MATRTIAAGGGNWNVTGTWVEGIVPVAGDDVVALGGGLSGPLTVTAAAACATMIFTNYTNTFTINSGQAVTMNSTLTFVAGMTVAGTGQIAFSSATSTITSAGKTWTGDITMAAFNACTVTLADNWTINGSLLWTGNNATNNVLNGNTLTVNGGISKTNPAAGNSVSMTGTTIIKLASTGSINIADSVSAVSNPIVINTAGTITITSGTTFTYSGTSFTVTAFGSFVTTGSTMIFNATSTLNLSAITWNNFSLAGASQTFTLSSDINVTGTYTTSTTVIVNGNNVNLTSTGSYSQAAGNLTGTTVFKFLGTNQTLTTQANFNNPLVINCTSLIITSTAANGLLTINNTAAPNWTWIAGNVQPPASITLSNSATWDVAGIIFNGLTLANSATYTLNSNLYVITLSSGGTANCNGGTIYVANVSNGFSGSPGTVSPFVITNVGGRSCSVTGTFSPASSVTIDATGGVPITNISFNNGAIYTFTYLRGEVTISGTLTLGTFAGSSCVGINKIKVKNVVITQSANNLTFDYFFNGTSDTITSVTSSNSSNYNILVTGTNQFSRFTKVSRCTMANQARVSFTYPWANQGNNIGCIFNGGGMPKGFSDINIQSKEPIFGWGQQGLRGWVAIN